MTHPSVASDTSPSLGEEPINDNENENDNENDNDNENKNNNERGS